jgi:NAD(P)-dependent dehydrogenase (short-subunit alcohol dehydrogenase family)
MEKWAVADIPSQADNLAVVTGANSGIGWHTALELARAGSEVIWRPGPRH